MTEMTKPNGWTGGPWTIEFGDTVMAGVEGRKRGECSGKNMFEICKIDLDDFDIPKRVAKANLKLIAAAPSLYEALKSATSYIEALESFTGYNLEVLNWHKNGDTAPFDGFFDENRGDFDLAKARAALSAVDGDA